MKKLLFATLVFFFTLTVVPNVSLAGSQTFLTNGTFTVPAGVTQVSVTAVGGGGGGGAGNWFTSAREKGGSAGGGGGGGGGAISSFSISVTPWSVHLITIGAGGSGGRAYYRGSPGSPGGSTSFGTLLTVLGGGGGGGADLGYPWGTRVRGGAGGAGGVGPMVGNDGANGLVDSFSYGPCGGSGGASILGGYGSGGGGACPGDGMWGYVGGSGMLMVNWVDPTFGTITTTSNLASASWTITGPATIIGSGISQTLTSQPTGTYTITWNPVAGYTTPGTQTLTLVSGGSVAFNGNYTASVVVSPPTGTITAPSCSILAGNSTCSVSISWSTSNVASPSIRQGGTPFSTAGSSLGTPRTLTEGTNTFTLYDGATLLDTQIPKALCGGTSVWNGAKCALHVSCGTANGVLTVAKPTINLCSDGSTPPVAGTGSWTWTCGARSCSAPKLNAFCGDGICTPPGETLLTCPKDCKGKVQQF